jgi:endoglucanase
MRIQAAVLTIRPQFLQYNTLIGPVSKGVACHLEHEQSKKFFTNDDHVARLGEDSFTTFYGFGASSNVDTDQLIGVSVKNEMLHNAAGSAVFRQQGSFLRIIIAGAKANPSDDVFTVNKKISHGINHANALESPVSQEWGGLPIGLPDFQISKEAGFNLVRIPVRWDQRCDATNNQINELWFQEVEQTVKSALDQGLYVMLNIHHYDPLMEDPHGERIKFMQLLEQISSRFKHYPSNLLFEICNEPKQKLNLVWNDFIPAAINVFRKFNRTRVCVVGPAGYNSRQWLSKLQLPKQERRIIVTVHYYEPMEFTHNNCNYQDMSGPNGYRSYWGWSSQDFTKVHEDFAEIAKMAKDQFNLPVNIGEFGSLAGYPTDANDKSPVTDMTSRCLYNMTIAIACRNNSFSFCVFDFKSGFENQWFGLYDKKTNSWVGGLKDALFICRD